MIKVITFSFLHLCALIVAAIFCKMGNLPIAGASLFIALFFLNLIALLPLSKLFSLAFVASFPLLDFLFLRDENFWCTKVLLLPTLAFFLTINSNFKTRTAPNFFVIAHKSWQKFLAIFAILFFFFPLSNLQNANYEKLFTPRFGFNANEFTKNKIQHLNGKIENFKAAKIEDFVAQICEKNKTCAEVNRENLQKINFEIPHDFTETKFAAEFLEFVSEKFGQNLAIFITRILAILTFLLVPILALLFAAAAEILFLIFRPLFQKVPLRFEKKVLV